MIKCVAYCLKRFCPHILNVIIVPLYIINSIGTYGKNELPATSLNFFRGESGTIRQSIIKGELQSCSTAKIRLLDYNTGVNTYIDVNTKDNYVMDEDVIISVQKCQKDSVSTLNALSSAFILIKDSQHIIFEGWIFSKNTSISLPIVNKKYVYLNYCYNK